MFDKAGNFQPANVGCSYTVKGPRHFQFSATRDDVIIECATLLAIMGRYTRCKESGGPRERERKRGRWRRDGARGSEVGVQVGGNRVSYSVDCVHRFGDGIL